MEFRIIEDPEYELSLKVLSVLYLRFYPETYLDYFSEVRAFGNWLIPNYSEREFTRSFYPDYDRYRDNADGYELQQLSQILKLDMGAVRALLLWAREEIDKHDPSNPQTSFTF